jgi:hypothetical protein
MKRARGDCDVLAPQFLKRETDERPSSGHQFVEDYAEAIDVCAPVNFCVAVIRDFAPLFGGHVEGCAEDLPSHCQRGRTRRIRARDLSHLGDAQIQ